MRIKFIVFIIALLFSGVSIGEHPLKMSFSKLTINADGSAEIETRIFLDDITEHIQDIYNIQQADFSDITSNGTEALRRYFAQNFYFEQQDKRLNLWINAVSTSKNDLALVINLSTTQPLDVSKEIVLVNTVLCDAAPTQINDIKYLDQHYQLGYSNPEMRLIPAIPTSDF